MLTYILFGALAVLVVAVIVRSITEGYDDIGDTISAAFLFSAMGSLVVFLVVSVIGVTFTSLHEGKTTSTDLQAISTSNSVTGSFFLGSGYIDSEPSYVFYEKNAEGFVMNSVSASDAVVIESGATPRIEEICMDTANWLAPFHCLDSKYRIYVPEGSVKPMVDMSLPK